MDNAVLTDQRPWSISHCNSEHLQRVRDRLKDLLLLAEEFKWLTDAYLSDYFSMDHWHMLKPDWQKALGDMDLSEIALMLKPSDDGKGIFRIVWPLSLLAYRASIQALSLSRNPLECELPISELKSDSNSAEASTTRAGEEMEDDESKEVKDGQCMMLEHCYRRHVKPKKQHEILVLAKAIHQLCQLCQSSHVIDVGAGQGHLCRLLSFGYGLNVTTIEASGCHAPKAQKFDKELQRDISRGQHISKKKKKMMQEQGIPEAPIVENTSEPSHVVAWIDSEISVSQFLVHVGTAQEDQLHCINDHTPSQGAEPAKHSRAPAYCDGEAPVFALTGLHACGDLTPTMLRVFVKCPQAVALASVGCCYMKMDTHLRDRGDREVGYPMSEFVRSQDFNELTWEAREMACHFMEAYNQRLLEAVKDPCGEAMAHLRTHCYRATLQEIILRKNPQADHGSIKLTLKKAHLLPFNEYAMKALKRLGLDPALSQDMIEIADERLKGWKKVVAFYSLRLALAPVIESIILLDRLLYLAENGISCCLVPLFDPALSPRNVVLLAAK